MILCQYAMCTHGFKWKKQKKSVNWEPVRLCGLLETKTSDCHEGQLSQIERFYRGREEWNQ